MTHDTLCHDQAQPVDEETRPLSAIDTPTPLPLPTPPEAYERFEAVFGGVQAPFAFLDLDAVWANAADMLRRSRGKPIRIASGSIRSRPVLERLLRPRPRLPGRAHLLPPRDPLALGARAAGPGRSPTRPPTAPA